MNQERTHIPFPQIPYGYFDGESKPDLPTPKTTVLFNSLERIVLGNNRLLNEVESGEFVLPSTETEIKPILIEGFRFLAEWAVAGNSNSRRKAKSNINDFCSTDYPTNYEVLSYLVLLQQNSINTTLRSGFEALKKDIDSEYKPLTNVRLRFYFEPHSVETQEEYEEVKSELRQELLGIFVKGEQNVFIKDGVYPNKTEMEKGEKSNDEAFKEYKSFLMALIYCDFERSFQRKPTHQEVLQHLGKIRKIVTPETAPKFSYRILTAEVLDEFMAEGYEINEVHEKVTLPSISKYQDDNGDYRDDTFSTFKNSILWMHNTSKLRNISIIKQANGIAQSAEEDGIKTNIFIRLGTNHAILFKSLPIRLRKATVGSTIVPLITPNKNVDRLFEMLRAELPIDEETWKLSYEETKKRKLNTLLDLTNS